jgi:hypothetical protein
MVTTLDLQRRGLPYAVVVDGAATPASLADLDDKGLPYLVEVADGATMASRRALEARGLRYLVPVLVDATPASKASLAAQGLRYAVQVDADILPADRLVLQRQGLACYVEVDSSGNSVSAAAVGGAALLTGETDGFATDFLHPVDAERVALKSSGSPLAYAVDAFYRQAGTSPKMVYDAAGTLGWSPHNYMLQSQAFELGASSWASNAVAITSNAAAAPDGTMTADAFIPPVAANSSYVNQAPVITSGTVVSFSVYIKNGTLGSTWFLIQSDTSAWFNLATGIKGTTSGGAISSNMIAVGSGWYRCDMTFTTASGAPQVYLALALGDGLGTGTTGGDGVKPAFYLWGAQMNRGSVPLVYLPTTTAARVGLALDYDPVTHAARGLWSEPQATNLALQSAMGRPGFLWAPTGATVTTSAQVDPSGGLQAIQVVVTNNTAGLNISQYQSGLTIAATYTGSMWLKGTAGQQIYLTANGLVAAASVLVTFTGAWQRVSSTYTASAVDAYFTAECYNRGGGAHLPAITFHAWGAQFEPGTVATSHIPTLAASVTRAADQVSVTPASINYSATAGSWWVDLNILPGSNNGRIIGYSSQNSPPLYVGGDTVFNLYDAVVLSKTVVSTLGLHKAASAFQVSDRAITADGLAAATDTGSTIDLLAPVFPISFGIGSGASINGYIRKVRYLPRRPTNAELVTMTT